MMTGWRSRVASSAPPRPATTIQVMSLAMPKGAPERNRCPGALPLARPRPEVDVRLRGVAVDLLDLTRGEVEAVERAEVVLELADAARPDERRRHARVAQRPRQRELRQRL